jgi:hypothetical protein
VAREPARQAVKEAEQVESQQPGIASERKKIEARAVCPQFAA